MSGEGSSPKIAVPFLHDKQIEREAELLLEEYALKFSLVIVPPVPVDTIAEVHLQLTLEYLNMKSLFPVGDVHGAIWFQQSRIGIDQSLDPDSNPSRRGRYHFTLAHEVGHWRLHRQHFMKNPAQRSLFGDGTPHPDVVCRSSERSQPVEWQANAFASCLLMPRKLVNAAWSEFRQSPHAGVVLPSHGRFVGAASRPFSEYKRKPGERVGLNWRVTNNLGKRTIRHVLFDTNFWKSFVQARLVVTQGDPGCLSLFEDLQESHRLFAEHLTSEYRIRTQGRGRTVDEWKIRPEQADNHWFDGVVGCAVAAAIQGCVLFGTDERADRPRHRVRLSALQGSKR